jgi:hypothetical protein
VTASGIRDRFRMRGCFRRVARRRRDRRPGAHLPQQRRARHAGGHARRRSAGATRRAPAGSAPAWEAAEVTRVLHAAMLGRWGWTARGAGSGGFPDASARCGGAPLPGVAADQWPSGWRAGRPHPAVSALVAVAVTHAPTPRFGGQGDRVLCFPCFQRAAVGGRRSDRRAVWTKPPSSSGLGLRPFKAAARVRIPLGVRRKPQGPVAQLVSAPPCHGGGRGFESRLGRRERTARRPDAYGQVAQLVRASA